MALQKAIVLNSGISLPTAYHKIGTVNITRNSNENIVKFQVDIYADETARASDKSPVKTLYTVCSDQTFVGLDVLNAEGTNIFTQCYEFLKTKTIDDIDYTLETVDLI